MKNLVFKYILFSVFLLSCSGLRAQFYSLGTNIPALGTATINAEVSMTLNRKWSLHLPVYYNPFVFKDNKKLQNFTVMPGIRYWLLETYVNGFVGVNAIGSKYHITWKDKDDDKEEPTATIKIDGKEHKVLEAGYIIPEEYDVMWVQFIIEDFAKSNGESTIEIQIPKTFANNWFALTPENPNWLVKLQNVYVGESPDMGVISEGKVLIKQLGTKDKNNTCKFQVSFEISLKDGTKAVADIHTKFKNSALWIGGR